MSRDSVCIALSIENILEVVILFENVSIAAIVSEPSLSTITPGGATKKVQVMRLTFTIVANLLHTAIFYVTKQTFGKW